MTLDINYNITNPRKVDQLLEGAVEDIQDGTGLTPTSIRTPLETAQESRATWWALRGEPSEYIGPIFFKDVGIGGSWWYSDGYNFNPSQPVVLHVATDLLCPANTSNNTIFRGVILEGLLGTNRELIFEGLYSFTNNANTKTLQLTVGSFASPTVIGTTAPTTNAALNFQHKWGNVGVANSQAFFPSLSTPYTLTASAMSTTSIDTAALIYVGVNIQLQNSADTAKINRLTITLR